MRQRLVTFLVAAALVGLETLGLMAIDSSAAQA